MHSTPPTIPVVTFKNRTDNAPKQFQGDWTKLTKTLTRHTPRPEKDGPAWSPTEYASGSLRGNEGVVTVSCFVADIDDGTPAAALREQWKTPDGQPLAFALHSSYSSTLEQPKYRVIFPLAAPVPASEWPAVHRKLTVALLGDHADPACKDAARLYYLPSCPAEAEENAFADIGEGEPLDPASFPDPEPEEVAEAQMRRAFREGPPLPANGNGTGGRPGDDFSNRGDVLNLLTRRGWVIVSERGGVTYLRRPGKPDDISATFGYRGSRAFHCFTSSASPFDANVAYSGFAVFALLEHGGDYVAAAKALAAEGFGEQQQRSSTKQNVPAVSPSHQPEPASWEAPVPFTGHSLPAFPVEALSPALRDMVNEVAASVQVAADMPAMLSLAVVAAASARRCIIRIGQTHSEPLNLFVVVTGEPGERKSGVLEAVAEPIRVQERQLNQEGSITQAAAQEARTVQEAALQQLRVDAAKEKNDAERQKLITSLGVAAAALPLVPALPRLLADDTTPEKLASLMAEQDGTMALLTAEGGIFGILAGRYSDGGANLDLFLKGHAGESVRVDRKGGASLDIPRARLTLGLAVQPDVLSSLTDTPAFRGRGLLGRFLYCLPQSKVGTRLYQNRPISAAARIQFNAAILSILSITQANPEDASELHALRLEGAALNAWAEYANDIERRQLPGADLSGIRDWASKLAGAVARIAGGFHLVENSQDKAPWNTPVSVETVLAAWAIGEYLIPHAQAAFGLMGADPTIALAQRLLAWIEREKNPEFSLRDCHRANRSVGSPKSLEPGLTLLCERGYLRLKTVPPRTGPGQPASPIYEVNPLGQNGHNTQN